MRAAAIVALLVGCSTPATQVLVWVDVESGSQMEARAVALRVRVTNQDGEVRLDETRRLVGEPAELELPASVSLVPTGSDASRRYTVAASLLEADAAGGADVELARQVAEGSFVANELREIRLRFEDDCLTVSCGLGRTCIAGQCRRACFEPMPEGEVTRSEPGPCPCDCGCEGDRCVDGECVPLRPIAEVSAGHDHACARLEDGSLACWGSNSAGQLGVGDLESRDRPTPVEIDPVTTITASAQHTCAIDAAGSNWCWGGNDSGQLGFPGEGKTTPEPVTTIDGDFSIVRAGSLDTCAARTDGDLFCWGDNEFGQLGLGFAGGPPLPPTQVEASGSAAGGLTRASLGEASVCALQNIGRLWCWGRNNDGPLGVGDREDRYSPELVEVPDGGQAWSQVSTGAWHTCGIVEGGALYCWGAVTEGRLGLGLDSEEDVYWPTRVLADLDWRGTEVAAGRRHTCAIQDDSSAWCFGTGLDGELGIGVEVPASFQPVQLRDEGWEHLSLGDSFGCGIRRGGTLWCWGANEAGQLGIGSPGPRSEPERVCF